MEQLEQHSQRDILDFGRECVGGEVDLDVLVCQRHENVGEEGSGGDTSGDEAVVVGGDGRCIEGGEKVSEEVGCEGG